MIVSHKHKFIYLKSYKTASTSVEMFFEKFCNESDIVGYRGPDPKPRNTTWWNHMTPKNIKEQLQKTYSQDLGSYIWDSYFKFGCIRNPWDRKLSSYFFCKTVRNIEMPDTFEEYCMYSKRSDFPKQYSDRSLNLISFQSLSKFYHWNMDYYIRFEKLHEDIQAVCNLLGLSCDLKQLPHIKKTNHKHYTEYYTDEMRDKIAEDYRDDIDFFNYTFGD